MAASKPVPHSVARHWKVAISDNSDTNREVLLRSFCTKGDFVEMISAEDTRTRDDAYIQAVRNEILQKPPFNGRYAKMMGLFHIATRRISHESNDVLHRHTGPKKKNGQVLLDAFGKPTYYPRMYILRLIPDEERGMPPEERSARRKKVLNTIAHILCTEEKNANSPGSKAKTPSPSTKKTPPPKSHGKGAAGSPPRQFSPTKFNVPTNGWDLTPRELCPMDWYITDQQVATVINTIYNEENVGGWHMFSENVEEADCFFSPPYGYVATTYGYRNQNESSVRVPSEEEHNHSLTTEQAYDASDVLPLDD